jgi:hypothetical protein
LKLDTHLRDAVLSNLFVPGLQTGDSLMQFERRIAVIGTLGDEQEVVIPLVQAASGMRVRVDASPNLVAATLICSRKPQVPLTIGADKSFAVSGTEECRALISQLEPLAIGNEGTPTNIRLRVWRGAEVVEDVSATIDAGDTAVGGCHRVSTDGHCDRFIQRRGNCVFDSGYQEKMKCTATTEQWNWGSGPY